MFRLLFVTFARIRPIYRFRSRLVVRILVAAIDAVFAVSWDQLHEL